MMQHIQTKKSSYIKIPKLKSMGHKPRNKSTIKTKMHFGNLTRLSLFDKVLYGLTENSFSALIDSHATIAQVGERYLDMVEVRGSIPLGRTINFFSQPHLFFKIFFFRRSIGLGTITFFGFSITLF